MKLVAFQDPIFSTIQGEGSLVGTPSTFIRLWGCDFSCSWCDTKKSWEPGSKWTEMSVSDVEFATRACNNQHIVVTGGNPMLQAQDLVYLMQQMPMHHFTIETQGSHFNKEVARLANLVSLSPKLHNWPKDSLDLIDWVDYCRRGDTRLQLKIVVTCVEDVQKADELLAPLMYRFAPDTVFYLQPEYGGGKTLVKSIVNWLLASDLTVPFRVLPQIHKTSLFVK